MGPLEGSEEITCTNMHPSVRRYVVKLPGDRPVVVWEGKDGVEYRADPVLGTVHLDLGQSRLVQVWSAELDIEGVTLPAWVGDVKLRVVGDPA